MVYCKNKLSEAYIVHRISTLRNGLKELPEYSEMNKAQNIQYYSDLARIWELLDLLPDSHWIKKETESLQTTVSL